MEAGSAPEPGAGSVVRGRELPKAFGALLVVIATAAIAMGGVPAWETEVFAAVNRSWDVLEPLLFLPMQLGSLFGPVLVAVGSWLMWRRWRPSLGAVVVGVGAWQMAKLVKAAVERGRPSDLAPELVRRWGTPGDGLGFVSGHCAVAFALAGVVSPYLGRRWRPVAYGLAALVAVSRIHVGAHYPLDTVGGAALGLAFAYLYNAVVGVPRTTSALVSRAGPARGPSIRSAPEAPGEGGADRK
jgi:undecaprenyl-diphosphatase